MFVVIILGNGHVLKIEQSKYFIDDGNYSKHYSLYSGTHLIKCVDYCCYRQTLSVILDKINIVLYNATKINLRLRYL